MSKSRDIADSAATINFIDTVSSDIQTQVNAKAGLSNPTFTGTVAATAFTGDGSALTGVDSLPTQTGNSGKFLTTNGSAASWDEAGGGAWEFISNASSSGSFAVDFTWIGSSGYSAYVIQFSGLTNQRVSGGGTLLRGYTMYGSTPTALTSGYTSASASYNSTGYTTATDRVIFPSIENNNRFNGYVYILNPESTSINEKSVSIRFNNTKAEPPTYSTAAHSSNTNAITGFRFSLYGTAGYDGIMGQFKLYGIKSS